MTSVSASEFNRAPSAAKAQADYEPVYITERGRRKYVLLTVEEFERAKGNRVSLWEATRPLEHLDDIDFDPPRLNAALLTS